MTPPRAAPRCASIVFALAVPAAVGTSSAASRIDGLIVRLHDAPAHAELAAETRLRPLAAREQRRWQEVIDGTGLGALAGRPMPQRRAVGRDQWRLAFGASLTPEDAQRLAERLRQRPEVAWVEPDTREPLAQAAPADPLYAQQWWLQPAGGTNANALADRRRGVPGFQTA